MSYESHKYYNGNLYANIKKMLKINNYLWTYMRVLQWM
jgi:hypothetical protein